jgi:NADPH:quinone reductase-like Zn-dependent oxidoreductase
MRAIQISSFGNPTDVLELIDIPEPSQPDVGLAVIAVEFAPINHNDLLLYGPTRMKVADDDQARMGILAKSPHVCGSFGQVSEPISA